ncbi:MAG: shikimate 5-dehydrogenase [Hyphomicrobiales bacterium]|nr:shikimate 5-dehydrogenase [Hyphomicrobiales bacterium]
MAHPERTLLAGVMGWPVMHSRSPMLHNYWFAQHGLTGIYLPLAIEPDGIGPALRALQPLGFAGCNLTIPHKETGMAFVDEVEATALRIGAISCVTVRPDKSLIGTNNDGFGFIHGILEAVPDWRADAGPIVVMGAGGGARAVVLSLADRGAREIRVINRSPERAEGLAREFGAPIRAVPWEQRHEALEDAAMLVNTTSQGMVGQTPLDLSLERLPRHALVSDIVYIPRETPLLEEARKRGNKTVNGLGMLLHQGRPAFAGWFGVTPDVTPELRAMMEATI